MLAVSARKFNCGHKANECRNNTSNPNNSSGTMGGRGAGRGGRGAGRGAGSGRGRGYIGSGRVNDRRTDNNNSNRNRYPSDSNSDNNHFSGNNNPTFNNNNINRPKPNNNKSYNNNRNNNNKRQRQITSVENDDECDDDDELGYDNNAFNEWTNSMKDNNYDDYDDEDDEEGFYDGINDYPIRQRVIKRVDDNKVFTKPLMKRVSVVKSSKNESQPIIMLADSGAQEFCVMEKGYLVNDIEKYDDNHRPSVNLAGAGGEILPISAKGKINEVIDEVYVCEKLDTNILSTNKLRDQGYWFIQPPTSISPDHAGYFFDSGGKLSLICNQHLLTDVSKMDTYESSIILPDVSTITDNMSLIYNIYGKDKMTIPDTVDFLTESFLLSSNDLSFLTISMDNFPVTASQIRKYYKTPTCLTKGNLQARNKSQRNFESPEEKDKHAITSKVTNPYKDLEQRNINIGTTVGTDVFGPVSNKCASVFVDKASGFVKSSFYKWSVRKQVSEKDLDNAKNAEIYKSIEWCINIYKLYGHKISTIQSDSINIYKSEKVKQLCLMNGIRQDPSPVGQHSFNGLAEITIKNISNKVTSMFCLAPYFPIQHWTRAWELAEIINNFRCSKIPGSNISRWEEFTHEKPNFKNISILPFGQPIEYLLPVSMRTGKLQEHSRLGMYCGPDLSAGNKGSIIIWNPKTLRFISQSTYKILPRNNTPYDWKPLDPGNFIRSNPQNDINHDSLITNKDTLDRIEKDNTLSDNNIPQSTTLQPEPTINIPTDIVNQGQLLDKEGETSTEAIEPTISSHIPIDMTISEGEKEKDVVENEKIVDKPSLPVSNNSRNKGNLEGWTSKVSTQLLFQRVNYLR